MTYKNKGKAIILFPTLEPDERLSPYIANLKNSGFTEFIIVDDGSGDSYRPIFQNLSDDGCVVLHHEENLGKGQALKTGFAYIQENYHQFSCVVMVDSDGQHAVEDVIKVVELSKKNPQALTLGVRDFTQPGIPKKSLIGNRFSSFIFYILHGKQLTDTQTGLRAFGMPLLAFMSTIKGNRFEYEMQMLIDCVQNDIPLQTTPIQVIYENDNEGTHFRPIRDSVKVIKTMFSRFIRFLTSSFVSSIVDIGIAWILLDLLALFLEKRYLRILIATTIARIISIGFNYVVNKKLVFQNKFPSQQSLTRYLFLAIFLILLSSTGVYGLYKTFGINEKIGKLITDVLLFFLSYQIQQMWVFKKGGKESNE